MKKIKGKIKRKMKNYFIFWKKFFVFSCQILGEAFRAYLLQKLHIRRNLHPSPASVCTESIVSKSQRRNYCIIVSKKNSKSKRKTNDNSKSKVKMIDVNLKPLNFILLLFTNLFKMRRKFTLKMN